MGVYCPFGLKDLSMTLQTPKQPKRVVDWDAIEPHYRAGVISLKELGAQHDVSDAAIIKHAKKNGWTRDLTAKIKAKADAKVSAAVVSVEVSAKRALTEKQVIEANADVQVAIRLGHRKDIARGRKLFGALMAELEATTDNKDLFARLGELLDESEVDEDGKARQDKLNEIYRKVISLSGRVDNGKKVIEMLEKLVRLEREAFGIDKDGATENPVDAALKALADWRKNDR
jgi:hypothetical protein